MVVWTYRNATSEAVSVVIEPWAELATVGPGEVLKIKCFECQEIDFEHVRSNEAFVFLRCVGVVIQNGSDVLEYGHTD